MPIISHEENMRIFMGELDRLAESIDPKTAHFLGKFCLDIQTEKSSNKLEDARMNFYGVINTRLNLQSKIYLAAIKDSRENRGGETAILSGLANKAKDEGARHILSHYHDLIVSIDRYYND